MISFRNVSCFLCFPVKNDKCFLACTTFLVRFAANKSKVLTDPKRNINPKNKSTLHWPIALKLLSTLDLVNFHNEHLYNAKSSWQMKFSTKFPRELNQISSTCCCRIKRGEGGFPSLCVSRGETKNGHISNTFYVRKSLAVLLFCSKPDHDAFLLKHHVASWAKKETRSTLLVFSLLTLFFSLWNHRIRQPCLQPTVKIPWIWAKDDIHTPLSQHKPPCTTKLQNRCQAMRLHSGGPPRQDLAICGHGLFIWPHFPF